MRNLFLAISLLFSLFSFAGNHPSSKITGEGIDLMTNDHSFVGRIKGVRVFGDVNKQPGHKSSTLIMLTDTDIITTKFSKHGEVWGGTISDHTGDLEIRLLRVDREAPAYYINVNGTEYKVRVEAEDYRNNHFINPTYILELDGKDVAARMHEGEACWMYSLHLIFMIFGTYLY